MELERIKGIQHGGDIKSKQDNLTLKSSQSDLAEELNISRQQLQDYKKLTNLIPELQQMIENGYKIWAKMPHEEKRMILLNREEFMKNTKDYVGLDKGVLVIPTKKFLVGLLKRI